MSSIPTRCIVKTEPTAKALKDGWLYTGDLGYHDEDGFLYFVDPVKDMVRRDDENILSEEVERVLNPHPQIAESDRYNLQMIPIVDSEKRIKRVVTKDEVVSES